MSDFCFLFSQLSDSVNQKLYLSGSCPYKFTFPLPFQLIYGNRSLFFAFLSILTQLYLVLILNPNQSVMAAGSTLYSARTIKIKEEEGFR